MTSSMRPFLQQSRKSMVSFAQFFAGVQLGGVGCRRRRQPDGAHGCHLCRARLGAAKWWWWEMGKKMNSTTVKWLKMMSSMLKWLLLGVSCDSKFREMFIHEYVTYRETWSEVKGRLDVCLQQILPRRRGWMWGKHSKRCHHNFGKPANKHFLGAICQCWGVYPPKISRNIWHICNMRLTETHKLSTW